MEMLIEHIKDLPPQLRDEVVGKTKKSIETEAKDKYKSKYRKKYEKQIQHELGDNIQDIIKDLTYIIQRSIETNEAWVKPPKWDHIPEEIFQRCVHITQDFIDTYHQPVFNIIPRANWDDLDDYSE